ncbi:hypothetical protein HELRODRAFT_186261 [Helobdella robusta]|uniref:GMP reductase n=1 Tax=Helobdella robusta TaxID=6412 RepID=T1FNV9_HELRO|nr:hypothetical protein HELRODRAFT_186261 [Helobdella robusta]ESO11204.1 hypothetical protein HELRODRAFT_186261 [Helobdella robusta]
MWQIDGKKKLDFKDVLIQPASNKLASRTEVDLTTEHVFRNSKNKYEGVPLMASNMDTVGTFEVATVLSEFKAFTAIHKYYSVEEWTEFAVNNPSALPHVAVSSGMKESDLEKLKLILKAVPDLRYICLDDANAYSEHFVKSLSSIRKQFPHHTIIAGNVGTSSMVKELIFSGADIVKVGIGSGSACTTREKSGVGCPQLWAVLECAEAAHGLKGHVISDGGCTCPGDVAKAFGAGADFVMLGGMLAGHEESGGEVVIRGDKKYKQFYGMASKVVMEKYNQNMADLLDYRASEGKVMEVEYRGPIGKTVGDILEGVRSACTYVGALTLKKIKKHTTFIRV